MVVLQGRKSDLKCSDAQKVTKFIQDCAVYCIHRSVFGSQDSELYRKQVPRDNDRGRKIAAFEGRKNRCFSGNRLFFNRREADLILMQASRTEL